MFEEASATLTCDSNLELWLASVSPPPSPRTERFVERAISCDVQEEADPEELALPPPPSVAPPCQRAVSPPPPRKHAIIHIDCDPPARPRKRILGPVIVIED
jgi:hypothetical protein